MTLKLQKEQLLNEFEKQKKAVAYYQNEGLQYADQIITTAQKSYANGDMSYWSYISFLNQAIDIKKQNAEARADSSPDPSCGRKFSRGKTKNPFPQKNRFSFCRVRIEAPRTARILGGQNTKKKNVLSISKENHPRENTKSKRHFFFLVLPSEARRWRGFRGAYDFGQSHHALRACD